MAYNTKAVAARLESIIEGLSGIGWVQYGAPLSTSKRVGAYITMGSQQSSPKFTGNTVRDARYFVNFCYRLDGAESSAETTLMDLVDAFLQALYDDLTLKDPATGVPTCQGAIGIDTGLADEPHYWERAGKEFREYPIVITARQYSTFNTSP